MPGYPDTAVLAMAPLDDGGPPQDCGGTPSRRPEHGVSGRRTPCLLVCAVNQDRPARPADTKGPGHTDSGARLADTIVRTAR